MLISAIFAIRYAASNKGGVGLGEASLFLVLHVNISKTVGDAFND